MGNKIEFAKMDVNKRPMSRYYAQISGLYFEEKRSEVDLKQVKHLSNPPTNKTIQEMVKQGMLHNRLFQSVPEKEQKKTMKPFIQTTAPSDFQN